MNSFAAATLANGKLGSSVDLNDLVAVSEFQSPILDSPFVYNGSSTSEAEGRKSFLMVAKKPEETIGFNLSWPFDPARPSYKERSVPYSIEIWNPAQKEWEPFTMGDQESVAVPYTDAHGTSGELQVVDVQVKAPRAGTYRFQIGQGGDISMLTSYTYDAASRDLNGGAGTYSDSTPQGFTFYEPLFSHTQSVYFYIPKGTQSIHLEFLEEYEGRSLSLYAGLPKVGSQLTRQVDIGAAGQHKIEVSPEEQGTVARIVNNVHTTPIFHSLPTLWAKSPSLLLVPRTIAEADGLTIEK